MSAIDIVTTANPRDLSMGQASFQADLGQAVKDWRAAIMRKVDDA